MDEPAGMGAVWFDSALHWIALALEAAGVAVILMGAAVAAAALARDLLAGGAKSDLYRNFRTTLARGILLGLEFLVAADIIGTVAVEPTLGNLATLALIVAIRTFLSFSLEVEIEGRLPWRKGRDAGPPAGP